MTISSAIAKALPAAEAARKWRPSLGHVYNLPGSQPAATTRSLESTVATPAPAPAAEAAAPPAVTQKADELSLERAAEEAFMVHMRHGGEYLDENPITGRPGEFHLTSTGRKPVLPPQDKQMPGISTMNGPSLAGKDESKKEGRADKPSKSPGMPKLKRKKSRLGGGRTPAAS